MHIIEFKKGRGKDRKKRKKRRKAALAIGSGVVLAGGLGLGIYSLSKKNQKVPSTIPADQTKKPLDLKPRPSKLPAGTKRVKQGLWVTDKSYSRKENNTLISALQAGENATPLMDKLVAKAIKSEKKRRTKRIIKRILSNQRQLTRRRKR